MTLTTHALAGSLVGAIAYHNLPLALVAALLSHPLLDAIPHWEYPLNTSSFENKDPLQNDMNIHGKGFLMDLLKIGLDFCLGLALVALAFRNASSTLFLTAFLCALIAIAPDPLQFVYWKTRSRIILPLQRFHMFLHAKTKLHDRPVLGILSQTAIIIVILFFITRVV